MQMSRLIKIVRSKHLNFKSDSFQWKFGLPTLACYHSRAGVYGHLPQAEARDHFQVDGYVKEARNSNPNVYRYISAYRQFGHLKAQTNPLKPNSSSAEELDYSYYGLSSEDRVPSKGLLTTPQDSLTVEEIEKQLQRVYCGDVSAEFAHLPTAEEQEWFAEQMETLDQFEISNEDRIQLVTDLLRSQVLDTFFAAKFATVKRYGGEGAESIVAFVRQSLKSFAKDGVEEVIMGMGHRGRNNVATGILQLPVSMLLRKMKGLSEFPPEVPATGDVLAHLGASIDLDVGGGKSIHVSLVNNPSHLEAANPVVCGKVRARQRRLQEGHYSNPLQGNVSRVGSKVAGIVIHGDAAIGGQGINQEALAFSEVPNFNIGGTVHMVTNNQVGYTTPAERSRSHLYTTDLSKMCSVPAIHVNGDKPEAVLRATDLAIRYQRKFRREIFLDLICWRRWGHNELDNPRFTNPQMYINIDVRKSVPDLYAESLIKQNFLTEEQRKEIIAKESSKLAQQIIITDQYVPAPNYLEKQWSEMTIAPDSIQTWDTGVDCDLLKYLGAKSVNVPAEFNIHPQLKKSHVEARLEKLKSGKGIDWATGEILAFASLMHQGFDVRLCGEDVGRGTFSQRHCMLVDQNSEEIYVPLNHMDERDQEGHLEVANSILSEEAVLAYEYGISLESPNLLSIWEAQFGDFFNGAQIILDAFLSSCENKWMMQSGLVLLLPHGYDGAGPEHSSCRMERFLQMCDSKEDRPDSERVNWNIIFPTNSAQIFHALRKQMIRNYRKPLVVIGPKALLRHPPAFSKLEDFAPGTHYLPVIGDKEFVPSKVRKLVFVSGKHFYALNDERKKRRIQDTTIIRLETLCPFPTQHINEQIAKYSKAKTFVWSQEEHRNMGAWSFVSPRFKNLCGTQLTYAGRDVLAAPAVGIKTLHDKEVNKIFKDTFSN